MRTKFILHGGNSSHKSDNNEIFFYEIMNSVESSVVNVLCVYFARPESRWEDSYAEDQSALLALESQKEIVTQLASRETEEFVLQLKKADVVFINGGHKGVLKETLESIPNFKELLTGKVVVGISAGANILSKYYYSSVADGIREGIGLLPVKLFTHYKDTDEDSEKLSVLDDYQEKLPVYTLPEEQFIVLLQ